MSSFNFCIQQALKEKRVSKVADKILKSDNPELELKNLHTMRLRKREKIIDAIRTEELLKKIESHPDGLEAGLIATLTKDNAGRANYLNVDYLEKSLLKSLRDFNVGLELLDTKCLVYLKMKNANDFVKAVRGEVVDDKDVMQKPQKIT